MRRRDLLKICGGAAVGYASFVTAKGSLDPPLNYRLRGTELRPDFGYTKDVERLTDVDKYVADAVRLRCNVMTIGPMDGKHFTAFPAKYGTPYPGIQPDYVPRLVRALHDRNIGVIGWLPFNVQDLSKPEQSQALRKHPELSMEYIPWPGRSSVRKVGMCVMSSPWRRMHAVVLKEAAALGMDGIFFDGFYLGGIPHPTSPGCVCRYCRESFKAETKLEAPKQVDWSDPAFKKWVRWRNLKLLDVARDFITTMREANPTLEVTCNYNTWPFGNKDWDTAVPLWATSEWGVSQHGFSSREDLEWVMVGYKARLTHDMNPKHSDLWRNAAPQWKYDDSPADRARHELTMRTFMLGALATGTSPWHGNHISPDEIQIRVHGAVEERERLFSIDEVRHIGVLLSQDTHDFYGHIPETQNLADYRDAILGTWLLMAENHLVFRLVFDNQLTAAQLRDYAVLLLPNAACLSDKSAAELRRYVVGGGRLIATGQTGAYDEWGNKRPRNALDGVKGVVWLEDEPTLNWLRTRDHSQAAHLLKEIGTVPSPYVVEAQPSLFVNA
ncbi:MAG: alpha-amylase family protein, partial [Terriglobales bacterium]